MDELFEQFVVEGRELVQRAADDLMALERASGDRARLDSLFRSIHTLKGSAAILDLAAMGRVLHAAEERLDAARRGAAAAGAPEGAACLSQRVIDAVLDVVGRCDDWVEAMAASGGALPPDVEAESERLIAALAGATARSPAAERAGATDRDEAGLAPVDAGLPAWAVAFREIEAVALAAACAEGGVTAVRYAPAGDCFFLGDDPLALVREIPGLVALRLDAGPARPDFDPFRCTLVATAASTASAAKLKDLFRLVGDQVEFAALDAATSGDAGRVPGQPSLRAGREQAGSLRVPVARVDALLDGLGELLVAKNGLVGLLRRAATAEPSLAGALAEATALLDRQVAEAHHRALRLRLVPLAQTFGRLPRLVRETAAALGKPVDFTVAGAEAEIDKALADQLFEPLLHLLRNAVDHGIEAPPRRRAAGKPEAGRVRLVAERLPRGLVIAVSDDGGGIDEALVREAAVDRGLLDPEAAAALDTAGALDLLFHPGFSTAKVVSGVSGRGVGLDAVRAGIAVAGGTIALESAPGRGSTFRLLLPQRAAIAPVMVVRAGGERWGIPADAVDEVLRLKTAAVKPVHGGRAIVHRDRALPVLALADLLRTAREGIGGLGATSDGGPRGADLRILVTRMAGNAVALAVDGIEERVDVLLRPAEGLLATSPALEGTAILGDGGLLIILDLAGLVSLREDR